MARDVRSGRERRADRDIRVARHERRDERQQRTETGREIDIHVRDDVSVACTPRASQCEAAALAVEVRGAYPWKLPREAIGLRSGVIGGSIVDDRDPPRERKVIAEVFVEPPDARLQRALLV